MDNTHIGQPNIYSWPYTVIIIGGTDKISVRQHCFVFGFYSQPSD